MALMGRYIRDPLIYTFYCSKNILEIRRDLSGDALPLDVSGHSFDCSDSGVPSLHACVCLSPAVLCIQVVGMLTADRSVHFPVT